MSELCLQDRALEPSEAQFFEQLLAFAGYENTHRAEDYLVSFGPTWMIFKSEISSSSMRKVKSYRIKAIDETDVFVDLLSDYEAKFFEVWFSKPFGIEQLISIPANSSLLPDR